MAAVKAKPAALAARLEEETIESQRNAMDSPRQLWFFFLPNYSFLRDKLMVSEVPQVSGG